VWPILIQIGDYQLGSYGVLLGMAALFSLWTARVLGKRDSLDPRKVNDLGLAVLVSGFIGSKLLGVIVALLSGVPLEWAELRAAGAVHGGLVLGGLAGVLLSRQFRLPLLPLLDALTPAVPLGQAIGRLGCWAAGCCFGTHSDLPWAIRFTDPQALLLGGAPLNIDLHPVQLYDAGLHFIFFGALFFLHRQQMLRGRLLGLWCVGEGVLRFFVESFRGDLGRGVWFELSWLSTGRLTALGIGLFGAVFLLLSRPAHSAK
jgi:phosphatidylglycerol---prolipoprotein diacylglyceryl transferase